MKSDNPYLEGKLTDRLRAISNLQGVNAILLRGVSPAVFQKQSSDFREYQININHFTQCALDNIVENADSLLREELEDYDDIVG